jgi:hypothetical protein
LSRLSVCCGAERTWTENEVKVKVKVREGVGMSGTNGTRAGGGEGAVSEKIEVSLLEKRLEGMRDTQESVQGLSLWCQANKKQSTPIIDTWLKVLRRSEPSPIHYHANLHTFYFYYIHSNQCMSSHAYFSLLMPNVM